MNCHVGRYNTRVNCYWDCENSTVVCRPFYIRRMASTSCGRHCVRNNHIPTARTITSARDPTLRLDEYANYYLFIQQWHSLKFILRHFTSKTGVPFWQVTNLTHNFFYNMFIWILYTFRATLYSSSGGQLYQYNFWYNYCVLVAVRYARQ